MAIIKALGKNELKELGCRFVVANVPMFVSISDPAKTNSMKVYYFSTTDEVKEFVTKNSPVIIFDETGVYKEKADRQGTNPGYSIRCCPVTFREFETLRTNLRETETLNFTYNIDFSCWGAK